jgi:hypothetical protein
LKYGGSCGGAQPSQPLQNLLLSIIYYNPTHD